MFFEVPHGSSPFQCNGDLSTAQAICLDIVETIKMKVGTGKVCFDQCRFNTRTTREPDPHDNYYEELYKLMVGLLS